MDGTGRNVLSLIVIPNRCYADICRRWTEIRAQRAAEKIKKDAAAALEEMQTQRAIQKLWNELGI
jgi:hypothetical protein